MASEEAKKAAQKEVEKRLAPMIRALNTVREVNDKGRQAVQAWADSKTRPAPAATDTGLVTVAPTYITYNPVYHVTYEGADPKRGYVYVQTNTCPASVEALQTVAWDTWGRGLRYSLRSQPEPGDEALVYRWRADELLAAERAESDRLRKLFKTQSAVHSKHVKELIAKHERERETYGQAAQDFRERAEKAEADNAAKDARVKELDRCHEGTIDLCNQKTAQIASLEAKLAAAEKALQEADEALQADAIASAHAAIRAVLGGKP